MGTKHAEPVGAYGSTIAGNARAQGRRDLGIELEPGRLRLIDATVAEITRERLWEKIRGGEPLVLVDALSPISFAGAHLPGAINITPDRVDTLAERRIPDRDAEVVVYCANPDCVSSVTVAARLVELGYTSVLHYAGGKQEWRAAGLPLEGGRV